MDAAARLHRHFLDASVVQWIMFCSTFVFAFLPYLWINLRQAAKIVASFAKTISPGGQRFHPGPMRTRAKY